MSDATTTRRDVPSVDDSPPGESDSAGVPGVPDVTVTPEDAPRSRDLPSAEAVLRFFRDNLGLGEDPPGSNCNFISHWYGVGCAPWCAMTVSRAFGEAGFGSVDEVIVPGVATTSVHGWAFVPFMAQDFLNAGRYDRNPQPGDVVIFDFGDGQGQAHVGVVEEVLDDDTVITLEGNAGNQLVRLRRSMSIVDGFGHPPYGSGGAAPGGGGGGGGRSEPLLKKGSAGDAVGRLQELLDGAGLPQPGDTFKIFGEATLKAVKDFQRSRGLDDDGEVGPLTWGALKTGSGESEPEPGPGDVSSDSPSTI